MTLVLLLATAIAVQNQPAGPTIHTPNPLTGHSVSTATYRVTFESSWSADTHPQDFPSNPHFSGLIGATHNATVSFWEPGVLASAGIESMAETGSKLLLTSEVNSAIFAGNAELVLSGGGIGLSPGSVALEFDVSEQFPLVTLVSMLAPSPDWFVGASSLDLFDGGVWIQRVEIPLLVYDAGTDSGPSYTSPNADTDPAELISELTSAPFDLDQQVGTFVFDLLQVVGVEGEEVPAGLADVHIFPNPTRGMLSLDLGAAPISDTTVEVFNMLGERVHVSRQRSSRVSLDLGGKPAGIYIVRLNDGIHSQTRSLVLLP